MRADLTRILTGLALCLLAMTAPAAPEPSPAPAKVDRIVVEKGKRLLTAYSGTEPVFRFHVALGRHPVGQKNCAGDNRTPEGRYTITEHKQDSGFYKALRISYPSAEDVARARSKHCEPGGNIMIHGLENGYGWVGRVHRSVDWTRGCIAITNEEMDLLWNRVPTGTPVEIQP